MGKTRVAVLFGGKTCEHDVSIISGLQALKALNPEKYEGFPVYLSREVAWYVGESLRESTASSSCAPGRTARAACLRAAARR